MKAKSLMLVALLSLALVSPLALAGSFAAFDFGGTDFNPADMQTNLKSWADRERWINEALEGAHKALEHSDKEGNLLDVQNYYNVLAIQRTPEYLKDPTHIGNLNAYATSPNPSPGISA
jgi:hypothetical protein